MTEEEQKELLAEAHIRGFREGGYYKLKRDFAPPCDTTNNGNYGGEAKFSFYADNKMYFGYATIYDNGQWATIINSEYPTENYSIC